MLWKDNILKTLSFCFVSIYITFKIVSVPRYLNFYPAKNKFLVVDMAWCLILMCFKIKEQQFNSVWCPLEIVRRCFVSRPPSCFNENSHESLERTQSNKVGRELYTHVCCEDVVYILDPVFFLAEVPRLPGASPAVIVSSSGLSLLQAASCSPCVILAAKQPVKGYLPPALQFPRFTTVWYSHLCDVPQDTRIRETEFLLKESSGGEKKDGRAAKILNGALIAICYRH